MCKKPVRAVRCPTSESRGCFSFDLLKGRSKGGVSCTSQEEGLAHHAAAGDRINYGEKEIHCSAITLAILLNQQ